ncbi:envelope glycoprotein D [Spheniscid alphaherpesvirus 1]|uniref:Envelope glycoprotein D n=1 Tax=Spheniscid alphaherpesvirus 1 TaxID=2560777 RepID=A0A1R3T486_9ALPH|nr:envelope glycoprotein D [Spheniscid alphaherpesvirus 1]SCO83642.1 envelope glycoprotein D [Spheniscid alphaherpesvirus 1]
MAWKMECVYIIMSVTVASFSISYVNSSPVARNEHAEVIAANNYKTTAYVVPPTFPQPSYNFTPVWFNNYRLPSPFDRNGAVKTKVFRVGLKESCGPVVLHSDVDTDQMIKTVMLNKNTEYNAQVAWYKIEDGCAYPLYFQEYVKCPVADEFGKCQIKTVPRWNFYLTDFAYVAKDELSMVLLAPNKKWSGQYTRVVIVGTQKVFTDFMVNLGEEVCWFSRHHGLTSYQCFSDPEFATTDISATGLITYFHRYAHELMVEYWYNIHGGKIPKAPFENYEYINGDEEESNNTHHVSEGHDSIPEITDDESSINNPSGHIPANWPKIPTVPPMDITKPPENEGTKFDVSTIIGFVILALCFLLIISWIIYKTYFRKRKSTAVKSITKPFSDNRVGYQPLKNSYT